DRTRIGGWPKERFDTMKRLITADWQRENGVGKAAFLSDVKWWKETFPKLSAAEREQAKYKRLSAYRATGSKDKEYVRWLAAIADDHRLEMEIIDKQIVATEEMRRQAMLRAQMEQQRHETQMFIISKIAGNAPTHGYGYGYDFNP